MQCTMKQITILNDHVQPMFTFSDLGLLRVLSFFQYVVAVFFSSDQAALRTLQSVCPSVCLSVCDTFFTMFLSSYHHEIFRSYYH